MTEEKEETRIIGWLLLVLYLLFCITIFFVAYFKLPEAVLWITMIIGVIVAFGFFFWWLKRRMPK
jgi:uncharacterized membrane protein AbrB (regulator of aidB expression)